MVVSSRFARGGHAAQLQRKDGRGFEALSLPSIQKEGLCKALLDELGISYREHGDELIHGCTVTPTHTRQDTDPTASLNFELLTFHCLGCGASGGILWFIAVTRGCSTAEALDWLNGETGLGGYAVDISSILKFLDAVYADKKSPPPIGKFSEKMLEPWRGIHPYLTDPKSTGYGRGIPFENCEQARIGYAQEYVISRNHDGSPKQTSERIVIPHFWRGALVGWQTRRLSSDGTPKYLSSPDFPKDRTLYNYEPRADRAVVVEAALSAVSKMHLAHIEATFGASVTEDQVSLLSKHDVVVLFMDNDEAGWKAVEGHNSYDKNGKFVSHRPGLGEMLSKTSTVLVVENDFDADPADMTDEDFLQAVSMAVPFSVWSRPRRIMCYGCREASHDGPCKINNQNQE